MTLPVYSFFFFFNDTATTEIYTLSLHDALPISMADKPAFERVKQSQPHPEERPKGASRRMATSLYRASILREDRKSTRLNSSHQIISYAVFCLKKKKKKNKYTKKKGQVL